MSFKEQNAISQKHIATMYNFLTSQPVQKELKIANVKIRPGTTEEDTQMIADCVCENDPTKKTLVSLRVSQAYKNKEGNYVIHANNTFRATKGSNGYNVKTGCSSGLDCELQKIIKGQGQYHLTLYVNQNNVPVLYEVTDLNMLRASGLLVEPYQSYGGGDVLIKPNSHDDTWFICITLKILREKKCLVYEYPTTQYSTVKWVK